MSTVVIIDYDVGNISSIKNMFGVLGVRTSIVSRAEEIEQAERIILPGVGSFDAAVDKLRARGLEAPLKARVLHDGVPLLGICLGMQILGRSSEEGTSPGLAWVDAHTRRFQRERFDRRYPVPHMGWNTVRKAKEDPILRDFDDRYRYYFLHSYHVCCERAEDVLLETDYGYDFHSAFRVKNIVGVQFHPEKSHRFGLKLFKNFIENF